MATPKLRFKEFDTSWERKSFGDITSKIGSGSTPRGGSKAYTEEGVVFIRSQNVNNNQLILENIVYIPQETHIKMSGSKVVANDILLNITGASIGRSCVVPSDFKEGNVNQHVCIIRSQSHNPLFIQSFLSSKKGQNAIQSRQTGSGREGINFQAIRSIDFDLPTKEEQTKIATFLSAVDTKIDELTQKHELLTEYKEGMMQQIFSQKLRFKADDGSDFEDWEEEKLGNFCSLINGRAYKKSEWEKEGVPVIRLQNLTGSGQDYYYSNLKLPSHQYCYNNDLLYMWSATFGPVFWQGKKAIFHYHIWKIETDDSLMDKTYMYYLLDEMTEKMKASLNGSTMLHVTKSGMEKTVKSIPSVPEQTKIADFLTTIDQKIDNVTEQIDQAKMWKKGLLQQMFV